MENLAKGKFYGIAKKQFIINGLTIVDSEFSHFRECPWHYHQNAHFAFTKKGRLTETHNSKKIHLSAGSLMYNHSQEPHCNSGYSAHVAALHVDIIEDWFKQYDINFSAIEGVHQLQDPGLKGFFYQLLKELKYFDNASPLAIESLVLESVNEMLRRHFSEKSKTPAWVPKVKDVLYQCFDQEISLKKIASAINIHPVYLCQQFPVYFKCSFGEYIRKIRIEKAVQLMLDKQCLLTNIAYSCGFADQSHFIKTFKNHIGITPLAFRKLLHE
jgi:AraC family transcriptional regulator